jgi:nucleotide-binding universal stress UspA family protein
MAVKHILYPTDFSEPAQHAGAYAAALARDTGACVSILHVLAAPFPEETVIPGERPDAARPLTVQEEERVRALLELQAGGGDFRGLPVRTLLRTGPIEHEILQAVRQDSPDVVVMGTHGRGAVGRAVLGGVTAKVVRLSPRPVLAVRWPRARLRTPFARLLVPLDGSALAEGILSEARDLAVSLQAELVLARVIEPGNYSRAYSMADIGALEVRKAEAVAGYLKEVAARLEADGCRARTDVVFGDPAVAILEHAAKVEADIIAMSTHGRSGLDRWLLGSVAEKVLTGSETPVLLYRPQIEAA